MANPTHFTARPVLKLPRADHEARTERAREVSILRPGLPALRVDLRAPVGIVVVSSVARSQGADVRLHGLIDLLPPGSWIEVLSGSVHRCRVGRRGAVLRGPGEVESWFRDRDPAVLYYPAIEDLEFGIHPLLWRQDLRISLGYVVVNAVRGPSTVHERLLVREMMMAVGDFWPGAADDDAAADLPRVCRGLSWLVRGSGGAAELARWKPRRAASPRVSIIREEFDEAGSLASAIGLATLLFGDLPRGSRAVGKKPVFPTFRV